MNIPAITEKLSIKMKLGYGIGDLAFNLLINATSVYLLFFYTEIFGITGTAAGIIFLISKFWNAAIDPFIGAAIDRTKTRWGSKRPYMLFGAIPTAIIFYMVFAAPELESNLRFMYGLITFLLFNSLFALTNVPYAALTATMTSDSKERSSLTGFRMTCGIIGMLLAAVLMKPLVNLFGGGAAGYRVASAIFAVFAVVIIFISFSNVREKVTEHHDEQKSVSLNLKALGKNYPFILLVLAFVISAIAVYTIVMMVNYYFKYNFNNEGMTSAAFGTIFISAIIFIPFWVYVANKTSKRTAFVSGLMIFTVTLISIYFVDNLTISRLLMILAVSGAGMSAYMFFPWAMVADTVEYSIWKSGVRQEGFIYGFFVFGLKFAQAVAGFIAGFALDQVGFVANTTQSPETLEGIKIIMTLIPVGFISVSIILILFYPINAQMHQKMLDDISRKEVS